MTAFSLLHEITTLPPELQQEVEDFVAFLKQKKATQPALGKREFGFAKGKVKIAPDFDAPLEDFNEYM